MLTLQAGMTVAIMRPHSLAVFPFSLRFLLASDSSSEEEGLIARARFLEPFMIYDK